MSFGCRDRVKVRCLGGVREFAFLLTNGIFVANLLVLVFLGYFTGMSQKCYKYFNTHILMAQH